MKNQQCKVKPTLTELDFDELHYYPFIISLGRCDGSCNTVENPFGRICRSNETEDHQGVNYSKTNVKNISYEYRCLERHIDGTKDIFETKLWQW